MPRSKAEAKRRKKAEARKAKAEQKATLDNNLVKALSHPLRARALAILNERVASPVEISRELGEAVGLTSYHVKRLEKLGCAEMVRTAQRRGATEHYYRGITRSFLNDENWAQLSAVAKNGVSIAGLKMINDAAKTALVAGTFDARANRHLSCTPVALDEEGWQEVSDLLEGTLEAILTIQATSASRQIGQDSDVDDGVQATISLLSFESPTLVVAEA
jgi:DNA-binding transcriptional ArsR family regulator